MSSIFISLVLIETSTLSAQKWASVSVYRMNEENHCSQHKKRQSTMIKSQVCDCTLGYAVDDNFKETVHDPGGRVSTNKGILKADCDITVRHRLQMFCTSLWARALPNETTSQGGGFRLDWNTLPLAEYMMLDKLFCLLQPQPPYLLNRIDPCLLYRWGMRCEDENGYKTYST